ncbi:MAG: HK97 gp10 family phage protein [Pseudobutyrivibrio sp.]|jgi:hypothetical protein|nr:HK97 gp10 family phage protein [Pseudobutyrivibrio sp.]
MISFRQKGDFSNLSKFLERIKEVIKMGELDKYGRRGVAALSSATPRDTGKTAESWVYEIVREKDSVRIEFSNTNVIADGTPVAILLQYGHATKHGGYVQGIDYINPAIQPIFKQIADDAWREVTR